EPVEERSLVDHLAACDIDEHDARLHRGEGGAIDPALGLRRMRDGHNHRVRACEHRAEVAARTDLVEESVMCPGLGRIAGNRDRGHSECARPLSQAAREIACPDYDEPTPRDALAAVAGPAVCPLLRLQMAE